MDKENEDGKGELVSGNFWRGGEEKRKKKRRKMFQEGIYYFAEEETNWGGKYLEKDNSFLQRKKTRKRKIFFWEGEGKGGKYLEVENICFA